MLPLAARGVRRQGSGRGVPAYGVHVTLLPSRSTESLQCTVSQSTAGVKEGGRWFSSSSQQSGGSSPQSGITSPRSGVGSQVQTIPQSGGADITFCHEEDQGSVDQGRPMKVLPSRERQGLTSACSTSCACGLCPIILKTSFQCAISRKRAGLTGSNPGPSSDQVPWKYDCSPSRREGTTLRPRPCSVT